VSPIRSLDEFAGKALLAGFGLPVVAEEAVDSPGSAVAAAERLGLPVALKVCSDALLHKSDAGGVVLGLADLLSVEREARRLGSDFAGLPHRLLVQAMAPPGVELIVGVRRDPTFGPVVLVGIGGILAEVLQDTVLELAPVDEGVARSMLHRLRGAPLLCGVRGQPAVDLDAAARAVVALSRLAVERPDVVEAEVNPLIVHLGGAVAVDALVRLDDATAALAPQPRPASDTLDVFFNPRGLALVGASRSPGKGGYIILSNLLRAGFDGDLVPVNPAGGELLGLSVCPSAGAIEGDVDLAMMIVPRQVVPEALDQLADRGVKGVILSTAGYADIGAEGRVAQEALAARARARGVRLMGPNSIGTINPRAGLATSIVTLEPMEAGGVSMVGQTGVFSAGWARWIGDRRPFGVAKVACIGNKADVDETDLLDYLADDDATSTVGMYLEGIADGPRFVEVATRAAARKPVVVLKGGRSEAGAAATASHTGSLATSDGVFDAVCRRAGVVRVGDAEQLFDALAAFEALPLPNGNRLGVLSITGQGCVASSDAAEELGLEIPPLAPETRSRLLEVVPAWAPLRNPVDTWSAVEQHGASRTMGHICRCLLGQEDIDAVVVIFVLMPESDFDIAGTFGPILAETDKPVLAAYLGGSDDEIRRLEQGFRALGVPAYPTPERALRAFAAVSRYAAVVG
jgi:acetate---CoA ligase (ADP-forming)